MLMPTMTESNRFKIHFMSELNTDELYSRSRMLFVGLLKHGLSLSTGLVAALSLLVIKNNKPPLSPCQICWYQATLILLSISIACALVGWLSQAMFYTAWATDVSDNRNRRNKWRITRNITMGGFILLFLSGVVAAAVFLNSFIK